MLLFWRIRYLDTRDKQFKDRDLWLETNALDSVTRVAVEATRQLRDIGAEREMLRYRHLFHESEHTPEELDALYTRHGGMDSFCIADYFEDENCKELTCKRMAVALTGDPDAVMLPAGAKKHDIDYMFAPKPAIDLRTVQVDKAGLMALAYFSRDLREMEASNFLVEGPGTISSDPGVGPVVKTAVSEDEIRSFVTLFRRLYMDKEPGNFPRAVEAFAKAVFPHPVGRWVKGIGGEYAHALCAVPNLIPFAPKAQATFTRKRLIDVFLYTQYAHQGDRKRERQYAECLAQVNQKRGLLFWVFLMSMWECALHIRHAGIRIASFTEKYCQYYGQPTSVVGRAADYIGMGELEKQCDREARVFREKAEELAMELWKQGGRPEGGPAQFLNEARERLKAALKGKTDTQGEPG